VDEGVLRLSELMGRTVLVKGPRQVGKTSLLARIARHVAALSGRRVVYLDFQLIDTAHLGSLKTLALYLGNRIARILRTAISPIAVWDDLLGAPDSLTDFLEQAVLISNTNVVLIFDEADRIFEYDFRNAFFAMIRAWHNRRASHVAWQQLSIYIAH